MYILFIPVIGQQVQSLPDVILGLQKWLYQQGMKGTWLWNVIPVTQTCLQSWDTALFCLTLTRAYFVTGYIYFLNSKGGSGRLGSILRSYTE